MEMQIVQEYLNGASSYELKNKYGFKTKKSILDKVKKYGFKIRNPRECQMINKEYSNFSFEIINNEFKAYFLGLLFSDGYITKRKTKSTYNYIIGLDLTDEDAIQFISSTLKKKYIFIKRNPPRKNKYRITLHGEKLNKELNRFGVVERKSKIINKINLYESEYKYFPYIIRGLIDGDGWIRNDGKEFYICSASKHFIEWLKETIEIRLFMKELNITHSDKDIWYLRTSLDINIKILKLLVYDKPFGMQRKYNRLYGKSSETTMEAL